MEKDKPLDPANIGFLGFIAVLPRTNSLTDLVEQVWRSQGFTAILVTHDVAEAVALADRVILLDNGMVSGEWRVAEARPRARGDAHLARIGGEILARLMARGESAPASHRRWNIG